MARECASCEFFSGGNCRRYPPVVVPFPTDNQHPVLYTPSEWWPSVQAKDWCGEYRLAADNCEVCGEPMPAGEEMFKFHGYSGPCPKPPLPREQVQTITLNREDWDSLMDAIERAPNPSLGLRRLMGVRTPWTDST